MVVITIMIVLIIDGGDNDDDEIDSCNGYDADDKIIITIRIELVPTLTIFVYMTEHKTDSVFLTDS